MGGQYGVDPGDRQGGGDSSGSSVTNMVTSSSATPTATDCGSAIAAEALMNNAGQEGISEGFRLAQSERAVPGGVARIIHEGS
jgi:hypothetical protein